MPSIMVDTFEPQVIPTLLSELNLSVVRYHLQNLGVNDYLWFPRDGSRSTIERKKAPEYVSEIGGQLDQQIEKGLKNAEHVGIIREGLIFPDKSGYCWCLTFEEGFGPPTGQKNWWRSISAQMKKVKFHKTGKTYAAVVAYDHQLEEAGVAISTTLNVVATSLAIAAMVFNDQKPEHTTLKRHHRTRIQPGTAEPYVETLMGLRKEGKHGTTGALIGEQRAQKLINTFGTPLAAFTADYKELSDILGPEVARQFLGTIGREP